MKKFMTRESLISVGVLVALAVATVADMPWW